MNERIFGRGEQGEIHRKPVDAIEASEALARQEEGELEEVAVKVMKKKGWRSWLAPYAGYVRGFTLVSLMAGLGAAKGSEHLRQLGEEIESRTATVEKEQAKNGKTESYWRSLVAEKPAQALEQVDTWKNEPFAKALLLEACDRASRDVVDVLPKIADRSYAAAVSEGVILANPELVFASVSIPSEDVNGVVSQKMLVEQAHASGHPRVRLFAEILDSDLDFFAKGYASPVLRFVEDQKLLLSDIPALIEDEQRYTQALIYVWKHGGEEEKMVTTQALRAKANNTVMEMNHRTGRKDRFDVVEGASVDQLYLTIVFGGDHAQDSTIRPLFDRLFEQMREEKTTADALAQDMADVNLHQFIKLAAYQHRLGDFLQQSSSPQARKKILEQVLSGIHGPKGEEVLSVMAQVTVLTKDDSVKAPLQETFRSGFKQATEQGDEKEQVALGVLSRLFGDDATWLSKEQSAEYRIELPDTLKAADLFNTNGESIHQYYFYNDSDGDMSFQSFLAQYSDKQSWERIDHGTFVEVRSIGSPRTVVVYANKPETSIGGEPDRMKITQENGWNGIADMEAYMGERGEKPHVQVHRGHSPYMYLTEKMIDPDVRLFFNGACGGADNADRILRIAPEAQLVFNTDTGKALINDGILRNINERLLRGEDIRWKDVRQETKLELPQDYQADAASDAMEKYQRYVFPDDARARGVEALAKYQSLLEKNV